MNQINTASPSQAEMKTPEGPENHFSLNEKIAYFKAKWKKEHKMEEVVALLIAVALLAAGIVLDNGLQVAAFILMTVFRVIQRNRMMAYVEQRAFDGSGKQ